MVRVLTACSADSEPIPGGSDNLDPKLLVSGEANFRKNAHAVVTLCHAPFADSPCSPVIQKIDDISAFPIPFLLEGDPTTFFSRQGDYIVSATVYMGSSDELYIGDFDEIYDDIEGPTTDFSARVSGLARCNAPESGGG